MEFITVFKKTCKLGCLILGMSGFLLCSASATTAFKGDDFYQQKDFPQALAAYMAAAETGSPHVYYQLGTIYYKGLGTKPNYLSAILWFSLAAEYQFSDSEKIFNLLVKNVDENDKARVQVLVADFRKKFGKHKIAEKYLPKLLSDKLGKKVTFGGEGRDTSKNNKTNELFGIESLESLPEVELDADYDDSYDNSIGNSFDDAFDDIQGAIPRKKSPLDLPYLAIIDYEVAVDGSIRNMVKEYAKGRAGNIKTAMYEYSLYTLPKPTFEGERINFFNRGLLGIAKWGTGEARHRNEELYAWVRRENKKLSKENTTQSDYKRAMLLIYYPWFPQKDGLAISLLKKAAENGHVYAQYEYGLYLYRKQIDPAQAVNLLSLASQFGLTKAQYTLARILQESPWVETDEKKAMFWYENASKSSHSLASLRLAELKLLASDEDLLDQTAAIDILEGIKQMQSSNPEYSYLVAISHLKGEHRDFPKVTRYLRNAISRGHTLNWDVSHWEDQLDRWTTGNVTVSDH